MTAPVNQGTHGYRRRPATRGSAAGLAARHEVAVLLRGAAAKDERAWGLLVGRFDAVVRAAAARVVRQVADRDEVTQRTWLAFVRHVERLQDHPAIEGWLVTTARREALRVLAGSRRDLPVETVPDSVRDEPSVDDDLLARERRDGLHRALGELTERDRWLLGLLVQEPPLSYEQVSARLGIPRGSIGPTRQRCIARLRGSQHLVSLGGDHAATPVRRGCNGVAR